MSLETEENSHWCIMIGFILVGTRFPLREKTNQIKFVVHAATSTIAISPATLIVANYQSDQNRISKINFHLYFPNRIPVSDIIIFLL